MTIRFGNPGNISIEFYFYNFTKITFYKNEDHKSAISYITPLRDVLCCPFQRWLRNFNILHISDRDVPGGTSSRNRLGRLCGP